MYFSPCCPALSTFPGKSRKARNAGKAGKACLPATMHQISTGRKMSVGKDGKIQLEKFEPEETA